MEVTLQKILSRENLSTKKFDKILCEVLFQNEQNVIEPYPIDVISGPESSEMRTVVVIFKCPQDICDHLIRLQNKTSKKKSDIKDPRIADNHMKEQINNQNEKMFDIINPDTISDDTIKAEEHSKDDISSIKDQQGNIGTIVKKNKGKFPFKKLQKGFSKFNTERSNQDGNTETKDQEHAETEGKKAEILLKENDAETAPAGERFSQENYDNKTTSQRVNVESTSFDTHEGKLGQGNQGNTIPNEDHMETNSKVDNELVKLQGSPEENIAIKNRVETTSQGSDQQKSMKNNELRGSIDNTIEKASDNEQFHSDPSSIPNQEGESIDAKIPFQIEDNDSNGASNDPCAAHEPDEGSSKFNTEMSNQDGNAETKDQEHAKTEGKKVEILLQESDAETAPAGETFSQEDYDNKTTSQRVNVESTSYDTHEGKSGQGNQEATIPNEGHLETNSKADNELGKLQGSTEKYIATKNCVETTLQGSDQQSVKNNELEGNVRNTLEKASDNGQFHSDPSSILNQEGGSINATIHLQTEDIDSKDANSDPFATHEPAEVERGYKFERTDEDVINRGTKNKDEHDIAKSIDEPKVLVNENEETKQAWNLTDELEKELLLCESDVDLDGKDNERLFEFTEEQRSYINEGKTFLARKCRRRHLRRLPSQEVETLDTFEILRRMREKTRNIMSRQDLLNNKIKTRTYVR